LKAVPGKSLGPLVLGMPVAEAEKLGARAKDNHYVLGDHLTFELDVDDRVSRVWSTSDRVCLEHPTVPVLDLGTPGAKWARLFPACRWDARSWLVPAWFCPKEGLWYRAAERLGGGEVSTGYVGVYWPRGKAPAPSGAFTPLGTFSNMQYTEEHQYGASVHLYLRQGVLVGLLEVAEGLQGDTPFGVLEHTRYDPGTGAVAFTARLTLGSHHCRTHEGVPSRDRISFEGKLRKGRLTGTFTHRNLLHPDEAPEVSTVLLGSKGREKSTLGPRGFDRMLEQLHQSGRGPRW